MSLLSAVFACIFVAVLGQEYQVWECVQGSCRSCRTNYGECTPLVDIFGSKEECDSSCGGGSNNNNNNNNGGNGGEAQLEFNCDRMGNCLGYPRGSSPSGGKVFPTIAQCSTNCFPSSSGGGNGKKGNGSKKNGHGNGNGKDNGGHGGGNGGGNGRKGIKKYQCRNGKCKECSPGKGTCLHTEFNYGSRQQCKKKCNGGGGNGGHSNGNGGNGGNGRGGGGRGRGNGGRGNGGQAKEQPKQGGNGGPYISPEPIQYFCGAGKCRTCGKQHGDCPKGPQMHKSKDECQC